MEINEFICESCGKRVEVRTGSEQLITKTMELKCPACRLKEKEGRDERLLRVVFS